MYRTANRVAGIAATTLFAALVGTFFLACGANEATEKAAYVTETSPNPWAEVAGTLADAD